MIDHESRKVFDGKEPDKEFTLIQDQASMQFWIKNLGANQFSVPFSKFMGSLKGLGNITISTDMEQVLQHLLDPGYTNYVSQYKFNEFLKSFGVNKIQTDINITTIIQAIGSVRYLLSMKWFFGFISKLEAEGLLAGCEPGTFLIRFGKSIGSFAIAFVGQKKMYHIAIKSDSKSFLIYDDSQKLEKKFSSLPEILSTYGYALTSPLWSALSAEKYFHGELSSDEANVLLKNQDVGTFLVRFSASQPGALAISFVDQGSQIKQLLIRKSPDGKWITNVNNSPENYMSIQEFLESSSNVFKKPFLNPCSGVSMDILSKWKSDAVNQEKIIDSIWKPFITEK